MEQTDARVWLESVEVREHGGNSAIYEAGEEPAPTLSPMA
jgi:hypothetical protein